MASPLECGIAIPVWYHDWGVASPLEGGVLLCVISIGGVTSQLGCSIIVGMWQCCRVILVWPCCLCFSLLSVLRFVVDDVVKDFRNAAAAELFRRVHYLFLLFFNWRALKSLYPNLFLLQHLLISSMDLYNCNNMDIMKVSEPPEIEKGVLHDQNALKDSDIGRTPNGMNSRDSEVVSVFFLCNDESCFP